MGCEPSKGLWGLTAQDQGKATREDAGLRNKGEVGEAFLGWGEHGVRLTLEKDRHREKVAPGKGAEV